MNINTDAIDEVALALLYLTLHDRYRAWKGFDWDVLNRLYERGFIEDPVNKTKSVIFTEEGLRESEIFGGFYLLSTAWHVLYEAQRKGQLATTGPYARIRHPQYVAFVTIMTGFLLQWPTLVTLVMFPILVAMYVHRARQEERESEEQYGQAWRDYATRTPRFVPRLFGRDTAQVQ